MVKARKHLYIEGRVQGVGFRSSVQQKANKLKINGWVKNLYDGRVEAVFTGQFNNIEKMIKYVKKGPGFASIYNVEVINEHFINEFNKFHIKY